MRLLIAVALTALAGAAEAQQGGARTPFRFSNTLSCTGSPFNCTRLLMQVPQNRRRELSDLSCSVEMVEPGIAILSAALIVSNAGAEVARYPLVPPSTDAVRRFAVITASGLFVPLFERNSLSIEVRAEDPIASLQCFMSGIVVVTQ